MQRRVFLLNTVFHFFQLNAIPFPPLALCVSSSLSLPSICLWSPQWWWWCTQVSVPITKDELCVAFAWFFLQFISVRTKCVRRNYKVHIDTNAYTHARTDVRSSRKLLFNENLLLFLCDVDVYPNWRCVRSLLPSTVYLSLNVYLFFLLLRFHVDIWFDQITLSRRFFVHVFLLLLFHFISFRKKNKN